MALDRGGITTITFDCYGTLIDWERGILASVKHVFAAHGIRAADAEILERYSQIEPAIQAQGYLPYRQILNKVMRALAEGHGIAISDDEAAQLAESIREWQPFPDTVAGLRQLAAKYRVAVISNIDDDLFAHSAAKLGIEFAGVITAQQVKAYKPSLKNFHEAQARLGLTAGNWLHAAESLFHDIAPANQLGIRSVWVNRRDEKSSAASKLAQAQPDATVKNIPELAELLGA